MFAHTAPVAEAQGYALSPAQQLRLGGLWKLTLPVGSAGSPQEIPAASLTTYTDPRYFYSTATGGVAFIAPVSGVTTSGSRYPRSELRELGAWSATSGTHTLVVDEAFVALPAGKAQVVGAQVHDASNDWATFRLESNRLYVSQGNNPHAVLITDRYVLGERFRAQFTVVNGRIYAFYRGILVATFNAAGLSGAYFRVGAYVQANCSNSSPCSASNFGAVVVYGITVQNTG
jgi:hypothetical protein